MGDLFIVNDSGQYVLLQEEACSGEYNPTKPDELHDPGLALMYRAGKRSAGRLLRGQEWNGYPEARKDTEQSGVEHERETG